MKIQTNSFAMTGTTAENNAHAGKTNKTGSPNAANVSLSSNSQFDKMIEKIQEQIQKVQESDKYDTDTKKSKIEELEKQIKEIEEARAAQLKESVLGQNKKSENSNSASGSNDKNKTDSDGVVLDISINAKALISADNSLKNLKNAHSTKVKLEGTSNVLASEIKIDKGRGVDTTKKETELAQLKEGVENSFENMGKAMKVVSKTARQIAEDKSSKDATKDESTINAEEKPEGATVKSLG